MVSEFANERFYKLMDERRRFAFELGIFVGEFARAEFYIRKMLGEMAGLSPRKANALLSGVKADASIDLIRRLFRAHAKPLPAALEKLFAQFTAINSVRNMILHYGADLRTFHDDDTEAERTAFIASNAWFAIDELTLRTIEVSPEMLADMTSDIHMISWATYFFRQISDRSEEELAKEIDRFERHTWLYKPAAPKPKDRKNRGKPRTQTTPRGSSPE